MQNEHRRRGDDQERDDFSTPSAGDDAPGAEAAGSPPAGPPEEGAVEEVERDLLLGEEEAGPGLEGALPPGNPVRTFVLGLAAVVAVVAAAYVVYRYVVAPDSDTGVTATTQPAIEPPRPVGPQFVDATERAGLMVSTQQGDAASVKNYISEAKGGGIALLDYDGDGWLDAYILSAGPLTPRPGEPPHGNHLMRNRGDGTFEDVTEKAGVGHPGFSIGVCAGDYDNDGLVDLYVTTVGPNVLYRNRGDGTFEDVTAHAGVAGDAYSVGATFLDYDADGDLDLFVGNYVALDRAAVQPLSGRWKGGHVFLGPRGLKGVPDVLYRNNGDGTFTDVSDESGVGGIARRSLGVVAGDADGDGHIDILVACDREPNAYYRNLGNGRFEEAALGSGLGYGEGGLAYGSQGIDLADLDNDEQLDVVVGNFSGQPLDVYRQVRRNLWLPPTARHGLRGAMIPFCTFGVTLIDYDNDGDKDIITANGHVYPDVRLFDQMTRYGLPTTMVRNEGPRGWQWLISQAGAGVALALPSRGLAAGDYDNDGDVDFLMANIDGPPTLLRNEGPSEGGVLVIRLEGTASNRSAIGARVLVRTGAAKQVADVKSGSGFASQSDLRVFVGLGPAPEADEVTIRWPSGTTTRAERVPAGSLVTAVEGKEMTWTSFVKPLAGPRLGEPAGATRPAAPLKP